MNSFRTPDFHAAFDRLPKRLQDAAQKAFHLWKADPHHPSLQFKRVGRLRPAYSVRINDGWRAVAIIRGDNAYWFWVGPHAAYDRLLKSL